MSSVGTEGDEYMEIMNSPVEFAIVGPSGGRDRLLVRSQGARLDLVGCAIERDFESKTPPAAFLPSLLVAVRQLNVVSSNAAPDLRPDIDGRTSRYRFAWEGYASSSSVDRIEASLNSALPDLVNGMRERDVLGFELAVSQIVYRCAEARQKALKRSRKLTGMLAAYLLASLLVLVAAFVLKLQR